MSEMKWYYVTSLRAGEGVVTDSNALLANNIGEVILAIESAGNVLLSCTELDNDSVLHLIENGRIPEGPQ